jgi:Protein of unknown function (DUF1579)
MTTDQPQAQQPPQPDPALKQLDRYVGTWDMSGRTLDSDVDNVHGQATFEWLPGGFFLTQRIKLDFAGYQIQGLEVIGYDRIDGGCIRFGRRESARPSVRGQAARAGRQQGRSAATRKVVSTWS